jgi:hypothetical protein
MSVEERCPLPIRDRGRGELGDLGGEVVGDGVDDGQRLAGLGQPDPGVAGVADLDALAGLHEGGGHGVVADDVGDHALERGGEGAVVGGAGEQVRPEVHALRGGDGFRHLDGHPGDCAALE